MTMWCIGGMCIGAALGTNSGIKGVRKYNAKIDKQFHKNLSILSRNYSYAQNELDKQAVYERDNAQASMYQISLNAFRNNALVESALGESGLEGRSQKAVARDVRGQSERQKDNIQASYENAIYSIKSKKDSLYVEYAQNVNDLRDSVKGQYKSGISALMEVGQSAAIGAVAGYFGGGMAGSFVSGALGGSASAAAVGSSTGAAAGSSTAAASTGAASGSAASQWVSAETLAQFGSSASTSAGTSSALSTVGGSSWSWGAGLKSMSSWYNNFATNTWPQIKKYYNYYNQGMKMYNQLYGSRNTYGYQRRRGGYY